MSRPIDDAFPAAETSSARRLAIVAVVAVAAASLAYLGPRVSARQTLTSGTLRRATTVRNIRAHLREFDQIARAAGGSRFTGTRGYARSVDYVVEVLDDAGFEVRRDSFPLDSFTQRSPTTLRIVGGTAFEDGIDMRAMMYSAAAEIEAPIVPVSFERDPRTVDGPACRAEAFDAVSVNDAIVLLRPGPCLYRDQTRNAARAGAAAVIFALPSERGQDQLFRPTLFSPEDIDIPVLAVRDQVGLRLLAAEGSQVRLRTDVSTERIRADNVIAETKGGDDEDVIVVGAHLDSVLDGPGINDNGSGSASLLELARQISRHSTENTVRFAFWGGEELGLLGSTAYVRGLSASERSAIVAYLNFDMVASPNYVRFTYSSNGAPQGSAEITRLFLDHFDDHTLVSEELDLEGRSDHGPFMEAGIPVGGLFTGAEEAKTALQEDQVGGDQGAPYDACYHQACDTLSNVNLTALDEMSDAIAHVVAVLAMRQRPL